MKADGWVEERIEETRRPTRVEFAVRRCEEVRFAGRSIRERTMRVREEAHAAVDRAQRARQRSQDLRTYFILRIAEHVPPRRRFVVLVRRMYVNESLFQRGEIVTDLHLGMGADLMIARGMVATADYDLAELPASGRSEGDGWLSE